VTEFGIISHKVGRKNLHHVKAYSTAFELKLELCSYQVPDQRYDPSKCKPKIKEKKTKNDYCARGVR
jgi:hypothetical protein